MLATLLHEAAHALAHVRGIQDTSRQGRFHNGEFAALGDEVGLIISKDDAPRGKSIGYSITAIKDETVAAYMGTIMELELALTYVRTLPALVKVTTPDPVAAPTGGVAVAPAPVRRSPNRARRASCGCGRSITVSPAVLADGAIICGGCAQDFRHAD